VSLPPAQVSARRGAILSVGCGQFGKRNAMRPVRDGGNTMRRFAVRRSRLGESEQRPTDAGPQQEFNSCSAVGRAKSKLELAQAQASLRARLWDERCAPPPTAFLLFLAN
jgi:hypothetical protein